ncbi:5-carboxymethyl-2-hydroxymuconate Delta-isomerase [Streptomyces sp. NPDC090106]|uniref:5-carboxymethyl-2-hydroxymuconate Delta-isomerase n=1 Tax=Streptomyces sp. NPDC090106 TaxID=3365946 RepID=UPI00380EA66A
MPNITVERSAHLDDVDWEEFARALHPVIVEVAAAKPEACKTRVLRGEDETVGDESEGHAIVHVTLALLAGRTDETKARLTEAVVALLAKHVGPRDGLTLHLSAEVRDLDASYTKTVL